MEKIEKLHLSEKTKLSIAEDINSHFRSATKYRHFLIKHDLLSFDFDGIPASDKLDFFSKTLDEMDESLFVELDKINVLSDESISFLLEEDVNLGLLGLKQDKKSSQESDKKIYNHDGNITSHREEQKPVASTQKDSHKTSAIRLTIIFLVIFSLIGVTAVWISDTNTFWRIFVSAVVAFIVLGVFILKSDGKIEDKTFVDVINGFFEFMRFKKK